MNFATVQSQSAPVGSMQTCEFSDLAAMLCHAVVSPSKEGPGWVPGYIEPGPRTGERVAHWDALALDVEGKAERLPDGSKRLIGPKAPTLAEVAAELELWGLAAVLHTTHTHEEPAAGGDTLGPRYRVVLHPSRPILPHEIKPLGLAVVAMLGLGDCTDTKCLEPARLFFLPRCPEERAHLAQSAVLDGEVLDVDAILSQAKRSAEPPPRKPGPAGASVIDAFNAQADIGHLLEQHGYLPKGRNRWMWQGSTSGLAGVVLLPDTGRVYSHHPGDPLHSDHSHDAFSVWCILNHAGDFTAAVKAAARLLGMERTRAEPVDFSALVSGQVTNASADNSASNDAVFHRVSVADVLTNPEPPHPFLWGPYIPAEALTLLSAHGGTGKSGFGLQLAAHVALGREFLGLPVIRTNTLFFSAEDGKKQLRLRLADICRNHQIDPEQLDESMHVLDATDAALLWQGDGPKRPGEPTGHYAALQRFIADHQIGLLIVDNASDSFGGDRFDKSDVTRFVRALVKLVRWQSGAVMLLSHVNRGTASNKPKDGGESYSDSVAWHNAARSRLFMEGEEGGTERTLRHEKSNYGPKGQPLALEPMPGCGVRLLGADGVADEFKQAARRFADEQVQRQLLVLVHEFAQRGEYVNPSPQANSANAWGMLRGEAGFPAGLKRGDVLAHFRTMERNGHITKEAYTKPNRHTGERWAITDKGHTFANIPFAPPAPACASDVFSDADALTQSDTGISPVSAPATQGGMGGVAQAQALTQPLTQEAGNHSKASPAQVTLNGDADAQLIGSTS